jgi:hypothetical protein
MTADEVWRRIQEFDIPRRVRGELMAWWHSAKRLVDAILRFMARHQHFTHCVLLGAIVCWLLCTIPFAVAHFMGLVALVGCAIGLAQDLRDSLAREFGSIHA